MIALFWFFCLTYTVLILVASYGWLKLKAVETIAGEPEKSVSVVIAVRNEAENILKLLTDLEAQQFPGTLWEVIIVDDHSEDDTALIVREFSGYSSVKITLLTLLNSSGFGKKQAIAYGISKAAGEIIVCTDGDCRVQPGWLRLIEPEFRNNGVKLVSGPVFLAPARTLFERMQALEFSSLIGSGAAAIGFKQPNLCNGANVAYLKAAFEEVGGFAGNEQVASGDDEFLMHKIARKFPGQVNFLKAGEAVVYTKPVPELKDFLNQRVRWASKWRHYSNPSSSLVALLVFAANLSVLAAAFFWFFGEMPTVSFGLLIGCKVLAEALFLFLILKFYHRPAYLFYIIPLQLVYVPYVVYCAIAGLKGSYVWKARKIKT